MPCRRKRSMWSGAWSLLRTLSLAGSTFQPSDSWSCATANHIATLGTHLFALLELSSEFECRKSYIDFSSSPGDDRLEEWTQNEFNGQCKVCECSVTALHFTYLSLLLVKSNARVDFSKEFNYLTVKSLFFSCFYSAIERASQPQIAM